MRASNNTLCTVFLSVFFLYALIQPAAFEKQKQFRSLIPGKRIQSYVDVSDKSGGYTTFRFTVPEAVFGAELKLSGADADLDLFLKHGSQILSYEQVDGFSASEYYDEQMFLSRLSDPVLRPGVYYLDVVYQHSDAPLINGRSAERIPFSLSLDFIDNKQITELETGTPIESELLPEYGMTRRFFIDVPRNVKDLRVDIIDTDADIDLMISHNNPVSGRESADMISDSLLGRESIQLNGSSDPRLQPGRYYITVFDQVSSDHPVRFSLLASFSGEAPEEAAFVPPLPVPANELENVLLSTVEVIAKAGKGSGCLVSKDGLVLTNWHVVEYFDRKVSDDIYIALNFDEKHPAKELFRAELVDKAPELDLALLKISGSLCGGELPSLYEFPYFPLGDSDRLEIGQPLSFFGYPGVGGTGSRASISVTRGIVSGFESAEDRLFIKTDAEINSGNSGGAAVDAYYQLLGIPTVVIGEDSGQIAYVTPVSMIPDEWLRMIRIRNI